METKILETSCSLFSLMGIQQLRMEDLARHLGVSKKTLYKFFPSREELVEKVAAHLLVELKEGFRKVQSEEKNILRQLTSYLYRMAVTFRRWSPVFFNDLRKHHHDLWNRMTREIGGLVSDHFRRNLEAGIQAGVYRGNIHPGLLVTLWQQHFYNDHQYMEQLTNDYSKEEILRQGCYLFLYGIVSPASVPLLDSLLLNIRLEAQQQQYAFTPNTINQANQ